MQPNQADALHSLGVIALQVGRSDAAVEMIRKAIVLNPNNAGYYSNLGEACRKLGRLDEAITAFRHAIQLMPGTVEAHNNLGNTLKELGRLDEAIAAYHRAIQLQPHSAEPYINLGNAFCEQGQFEDAIAACRTALQLKPDSLDAHNNLGNALREQGHLDDSIVAYRRAIALSPNCAEAHSNLGNALRDRGQLDEAAAACRRAIQFKPDFASAHYNLANALLDQGCSEEAIASYGRAIELNPNFAAAFNNLGNALTIPGRTDEAAAACRRAIELKPDFSEAYNSLGNVLKDQGRIDEAITAFRHSLQLKPDCAGVHSNLIYSLHFHQDCDEAAIFEEQRRWNRQFAEPSKHLIQPHDNNRISGQRLRIGYISPDFRDHVVGRNLRPLFLHHDRSRFEIICYSGVIQPDGLTDEFRRHADQWRSSAGIGDADLARMIRSDRIEVLVDLTQHMAGNRLPLFARKPAPVQVSFAGYPAGTGLETIESRITDRHLERGRPSNAEEKIEHLYFLDSFWCYDPCGFEMEFNPLPALSRAGITFGCLNNFCKVNEPLLQLWVRVLSQVVDSRILILSHQGDHRERVFDIFAKSGIDRQRVEFAEPRKREDYLALFHSVDVLLDTYPYNGHTTSLDALWMGVPVVTLAGEMPVSRAGLSQLTNLGLPEFVSHTHDDYVQTAVRLAHDFPRLAALRATLRPRMEASILMDAPRFARQIEAAYCEMWAARCAAKQA